MRTTLLMDYLKFIFTALSQSFGGTDEFCARFSFKNVAVTQHWTAKRMHVQFQVSKWPTGILIVYKTDIQNSASTVSVLGRIWMGL